MTIEIRTRKLANGNKSLYLDIYDKGKRKYESLQLYLVPEINDDAIRMNKNAMKKAVAVKSHRMLGIEPEVAPVTTQAVNDSPLLTDTIDRYLSDAHDNGSSKTHCHNIALMRTIMLAFLAKTKRSSIRLLEIDKRFVVDFIDFIRKGYVNKAPGYSRELLAPQTQYMQQNIFATFLRKLFRRGMIPTCPIDKLEKREKIAKPVIMRDSLTIEELQALSEVETGSPGNKAAFMFSCFTGLRYCDICSLTWADVRTFDDGLAVYTLQEKTKQTVTIPIGEQARRWLPERGNDGDKVFAVATLGACNRSLSHMAKRAGLTKHISFHTARHTFACIMVDAGGDVLVVSKLLGHSSIKTTMRYADVNLDNKIAAVNVVKGLFG